MVTLYFRAGGIRSDGDAGCASCVATYFLRRAFCLRDKLRVGLDHVPVSPDTPFRPVEAFFENGFALLSGRYRAGTACSGSVSCDPENRIRRYRDDPCFQRTVSLSRDFEKTD